MNTLFLERSTALSHTPPNNNNNNNNKTFKLNIMNFRNLQNRCHFPVFSAVKILLIKPVGESTLASLLIVEKCDISSLCCYWSFPFIKMACITTDSARHHIKG